MARVARRPPPRFIIDDYVPLPEPVTSWGCLRAKQMKETAAYFEELKQAGKIVDYSVIDVNQVTVVPVPYVPFLNIDSDYVISVNDAISLHQQPTSDIQ